jgi:hypothetical protein
LQGNSSPFIVVAAMFEGLPCRLQQGTCIRSIP